MTEITIKIPGLQELADAMRDLALAKQGHVVQYYTSPAPEAPAAPAPEEKPAPKKAAKKAAPKPEPEPEFIQEALVLGVTEPDVPVYSLNDLATAATKLVDDGKQEELIYILKGFGVPSLVKLPERDFPAFAEQIRALGAEI